MGKIQKVGRWVAHELNERQIERRKNTCEILLERYRRKSFLHHYWGWKVNFFWESQAQKIMGKPRRIIHIDRKTESLAGRRCSVFSETRRVWFIMSYWSLAKRLIPNAINNNWSIWTVRCLKNDQNSKRGNTRSFFSMTMLYHIQQNQFGIRWKHSAGKFNPMRPTH